MTQKLFALANDKCAPESPDNPMNQEILLGGHVYLLVLKVSTVLFHLGITSIPNGFHDIGDGSLFPAIRLILCGSVFSQERISLILSCEKTLPHSYIVRKIFRLKRFQTIL